MSLNPDSHADVIIIGGGAAGLMCAIVAGRRGRKVLLLEHNERIGKKILISGGGRCNFTNLGATAANYLSAHPDFCKSALARYTPYDFISLVEQHNIAYHEKTLGQQFCDTSSREIVELLLRECDEAGVQVRTGCRVTDVRKPGTFHVETSSGDFTCDSLVIATGGLSFPNLGATDFGYRIAKQFDLALTELRPGLVPLTFLPSHQKRFSELSGLSLPVTIHYKGRSFTESMLITHRGISGPAVLQISSYWEEGGTLEIDLMPGVNGKEFLKAQGRSGTTLERVLAQAWPARFAEAWAPPDLAARRMAELSGKQLDELGAQINRWPIAFAGTEGYAKAEVTLGGVATSELSSKTMEARRVPGLFFIGEVVDVTGWLGGYNFQWAWASGNAAGQAV
jgi:predicted Rossmann fold flavoprotein